MPKAQTITETKVYVACPNCGEAAGRIDHLFDGKAHSTRWNCDECGWDYNLSVHGPDDVQTSVAETYRRKTYDLLVIPPRAEPVYLVVNGTLFDCKIGEEKDEDGKQFYYDEHTCPTNWVDRIEAFCHDGDVDPHGVAQFVRSVPVPEYEGDCNDDNQKFKTLFPELRVPADEPWDATWPPDPPEVTVNGVLQPPIFYPGDPRLTKKDE